MAGQSYSGVASNVDLTQTVTITEPIDNDAQAAAARDTRAAVWAHYIAKGVPKARLAEMSGVSRAAITDALRRREGRHG